MSVDPEWRQMTFEELLTGNKGETLKTPQSDEKGLGTQCAEDSGTAHLLEKVLARQNLQMALKRVKGNRGSPGIDGMTVDELSPWLKEHWVDVRAAIAAGTYCPTPVKRREIKKEGGGFRQLGIPTVLDRLIQQAILQVLQPLFDPSFSDFSYGFRPKRSAHDALRQAKAYIQEGRHVVVDVDLEKFFDRVNHDVLMDRLGKRIEDRRLLRLIRRYLESGVMVNGVKVELYEGTPQGGPLSPLLANVLLDDVDKELEKRGHAFVRYADDGQVYVRSLRAGERVFALLRRVFGRLRLRINEEKSAVRSVFQCDFLGFTFWVGRSGVVQFWISKKALVRMQDRVRTLTKRSGGRSMAQVVEKLRSFLIGWRGYFRLVDTRRTLEDLDGWIRRRVRALQLHQWKRGRKVFDEMKARGASAKLAASIAYQNRRWWRNSRLYVHGILNNSWADKLGVPRLAPLTST